jgi:hypothetical protein
VSDSAPEVMPRALENHPDVRPHADGRCDEEGCPSYDGKRCRQIGGRPDTWCEPWVLAMRAELHQLRLVPAHQSEEAAMEMLRLRAAVRGLPDDVVRDVARYARFLASERREKTP